MYWNTVQVVNCTIQNTQAICLWNVKKALNFFCYCPNVVAFWGVKRWSWRSGTAAIRVSSLEKVSKNLLLKKFQSIGSCPIARVFWYLRNVSIGKSLFTCVQETSKRKRYLVPTILTRDHYLWLRKLLLYITFFRESKISLALVYKSSWYLHRKYTIQIVRFLDTSLALAGHSSSLQYEPCEGHPKLTQRSKHRRYSRLDF